MNTPSKKSRLPNPGRGRAVPNSERAAAAAYSAIVKCFGPKATDPFDLVEQGRAAEEFTHRSCGVSSRPVRTRRPDPLGRHGNHGEVR